MSEQDKEYLRDLIAMFKSVTGAEPEECYKFADEMMDARKPKQVGIKSEGGIVAIKRRTKK